MSTRTVDPVAPLTPDTVMIHAWHVTPPDPRFGRLEGTKATVTAAALETLRAMGWDVTPAPGHIAAVGALREASAQLAAVLAAIDPTEEPS